ncbi:MAG TPA: winged helix-turn-helix domain-containing protein [Steroidobacteraceae bacterium]
MSMDPIAEPLTVAVQSRCLSFDGWTLDRITGDLWKQGIRQRLQEQPLQILDELLAKPGELVTREQLIGRLWPKGVVDFDTGLNTAVRKLRLSLGDHPTEPRYIETLPRKGYRFIGRVELPQPTPKAENSGSPGVDGGSAAVLAAPAGVTADKRHDAPRRSLIVAVAAAGMLLCTALLIIWHFANRPSSLSQSIPPVAYDLYLAATARQPEISPNEGAEPRQRVLDLLGRALAIDPSLVPAYVVRARTNLDYFVSNLDVSSDLLAAVRKDLETARRLSGNDRIGLDVRSAYAALVEQDPERGLRLADSAPDDPDVLQTKAMILMTLGRFRESDEIYDRFLALDPENQRMLRIKLTNLLVERRSREALELINTLRRVSPPNRVPGNWMYPMTGAIDFPRPSFVQMKDSLQLAHLDEERLSQLLSELGLMRVEHRYDEIRDLLDEVAVESIRVPLLTGAMPGVGRMPVAVVRGWNEMLRGDTAAAAENGRKILEFVASQQVTRWNKWHLRILEGEGHVFMGDSAGAVAAVRASFAESPAPLKNRHMEIFRQHVAAITLAWAGDYDGSLELLEKLSRGVPSIGPAVIARDPLFSLPLTGNTRFEELTKGLEMEMQTNRSL